MDILYFIWLWEELPYSACCHLYAHEVIEFEINKSTAMIYRVCFVDFINVTNLKLRFAVAQSV
jgi:hypothetical protein